MQMTLFPLLASIATERGGRDVEDAGYLSAGESLVERPDGTFTQIEGIGTHAALLFDQSVAWNHSMRKTL